MLINKFHLDGNSNYTHKRNGIYFDGIHAGALAQYNFQYVVKADTQPKYQEPTQTHGRKPIGSSGRRARDSSA